MFKKVLSFMMAICMVASLACTVVSAKTTDEKILQTVAKANAKIAKEVEKALKKGAKFSEDDIAKLIAKTGLTAAKTMVKAEKDGAVVECEYIVVEINGTLVLIDPLRVIRA